MNDFSRSVHRSFMRRCHSSGPGMPRIPVSCPEGSQVGGRHAVHREPRVYAETSNRSRGRLVEGALGALRPLRKSANTMLVGHRKGLCADQPFTPVSLHAIGSSTSPMRVEQTQRYTDRAAAAGGGCHPGNRARMLRDKQEELPRFCYSLISNAPVAQVDRASAF